MAEDNSQDNLERSEEATPKRRDEARKRGQFARSKELIPASTLIMLLIAMRFAGAELLDRQGRLLAGFLSAAGTMKQFDVNDLSLLSYNAGGMLAPVLLPVFGAVLVAALASGFMQTGMVLAEEPVRFDLARISPLAGWRRLFSLDAVADLIKAMLFIGALGWIGGKTIYGELPALASLANIGVAEILEYTAQEASFIGTWIIATLAALASLDYLFQRWRTETKLRMSRQEVKEEMREQDGDPLLRSRIKSLRQKMARQRMMSEVAKADVVITNPTELAIALRYRAGEMSAPKVLGKGAGYVAQKIREVARGNSIPIVENKPLARLLFKEVEIGREVPEALYRAVAETLAYVYRLRRGGAASANPEAGRG
jgi:flagellar biosynthesis protein FlhB